MPIFNNQNLINDNGATGFVDIGSVRIQWGTASQAGGVAVTVTLPTTFANTNYKITMSPIGTASYVEVSSVQTKSTSSFTFLTTYYNGSFGVNNGRVSDWIAIGLKP